MKDFFSQIYRVIVPKFFRKKIRSKKLRSSILNYYAKPSSIISDELKEVLNYLENHPLTIFPYPFQNNYKAADIEIFKDEIKGLRYVLLDGKRLYFKMRWSEKRIRHSFNELKKEQDAQSPHRYLSDNFNIENGEILADIGVAEGNFALGAVEKAKALYLFETDKEWIEALNATFEPWKEKVNIINKYVGDKNNSKQTTLDDFFKEGEAITFLKIDVDGAEAKLLKGCERILSHQSPLKVALCTYHKQEDEKEFNSLLTQKGFNISHSDGYMLFYTDKKIKAPYFRRGLIRAVKK
jgi:hypothetical protein